MAFTLRSNRWSGLTRMRLANWRVRGEAGLSSLIPVAADGWARPLPGTRGHCSAHKTADQTSKLRIGFA